MPTARCWQIWASGLHCCPRCAWHDDVMTSLKLVICSIEALINSTQQNHAHQGVPYTPTDDRGGIPHCTVIHDSGKWSFRRLYRDWIGISQLGTHLRTI
ncbi:unnamed protein product [Haemonchus placei]|uniref:Secreted protein n=1 Tax=Haemonchus placei TaxID=6290 RepID=A0A0N4W471_HAEPC|nr:unnamed protein product [Haemonchus placei]